MSSSPRERGDHHHHDRGGSSPSSYYKGRWSPKNAVMTDSFGSPIVQHHQGSAASVTSAGSFAFSTASSGYRHHAAPFLPQTPLEEPRTKLFCDAKHKPKTRGSVGILVVGLGGSTGLSVMASILANRMDLTWRGPKGELKTANYNSCLTQEGNHFPEEVQKALAPISMAAIGGWDISSQKLGDALLDAQILDYDLVRQVREEMNKQKVFRGMHDGEFCSKTEGTHVLSQKEAPNASEALKCLRADIRYFKWRNGVVGHTTVLWCAGQEELVKVEAQSARDLLNCMEDDTVKLPPSVLYATAALLEGCSFVECNSDSILQNCLGLLDLARQQVGVYCLGSNFVYGNQVLEKQIVGCLQTTMGMTTTVMTTTTTTNTATTMTGNSNHGVSRHSSSSSLSQTRDKQAADENNKNDKSSNDNGPVIVEYQSVGFLGEPHTVLTQLKESKPHLCAPLLMDVAVWCDLFSSKSWPYEKVAKAFGYMFATPLVDTNGGTTLEELKSQALAAVTGLNPTKSTTKKKKRVRILPEEKATEWAIPHDARIICAGLACVDMQLNHATGGSGGEAIETFEGSKSIGGGSVSMACKTLARLCHGAPLDEDYMQVTPPVVHSVVPLCKIGNDDSGNKLVDLLEECGGACRNVETKYIKEARSHDETARTALSVLPIYRDGRRGCFFDAASNTTFSQWDMVEFIHCLTASNRGPSLDLSQLSEDDVDLYKERVSETAPIYGAFLFGYPHLLPLLQGDALANVFREARTIMEEGGIVALDLNGVPERTWKAVASDSLRSIASLREDAVIGAALEHVDILHMNEEELVLLTGCEIDGSPDSRIEDEFAIVSAVNLFLECGVAIVAVTRGKKGSFVSCSNEERFTRSPLLPASWTDCTANIAAVELPRGTVINTNGAGDSFTSGLLVASMLRHTGMSVPVRKNTEMEEEDVESDGDQFLELEDLGPSPTRAPRVASPPKTKLSPYTLYMRENYITLKRELQDDKKAIFSRCHEMWENETEEVKLMYERRAAEEIEDEQNEASVRLDNDLEALDSTPRNEPSEPSFSTDYGGNDEAQIRSLYMTNRALNLESAVQFASLVAAHHIDVSTRDLMHLDMSRLLERAMIFPHGLEEI